MVMAEAEVIALKEALHNQSLIIKELHAELEEERKASASGADEALSVIMRLREEKSVENMEACQYKRMAEEKLQYAEESMLILKEIIIQKDMECLSLKCQLQEHKNKLFSLGFDNATFEKRMSNGSSWLIAHSAFLRKSSFTRNISLPAVRLEELVSEMKLIDNSCSLLPNEQGAFTQSGDYTQKPPEEFDGTKVHSSSDKCGSESKEIKKETNIFPQPKKFKDEPTFNEMQASSSKPRDDRPKNSKLSMMLKAQGIRPLPFHATDAWKRLRLRSANNPVFRTKSEGDTSLSVCLQDIQEDQDCDENSDIGVTPSCKLGEHYFEPNQHTQILASSHTDVSNHSLNNHCEQLSPQLEKTSVVCLENQVAQVIDELKQLKKSMQNVQIDIRIMKQERYDRESEHSRLLNRITEQLDRIGAQEKNPRIMDHYRDDESLVTYFVEVCLLFVFCMLMLSFAH